MDPRVAMDIAIAAAGGGHGITQWLEQTSHPKLRDDQSLLNMAIYCSEVDLSEDATDGVYAWGDAARFEDERCRQADRAAFAAFPKHR